jgi:hypothetical protein
VKDMDSLTGFVIAIVGIIAFIAVYGYKFWFKLWERLLRKMRKQTA